MKKLIVLVVSLFAVFILTGCSKHDSISTTVSPSPSLSTSITSSPSPSPSPTTIHRAGETNTFIINGISFKLHYVPAVVNFPYGIDDKTNVSVKKSLWMAETETTYALWKEVYEWACQNGYELGTANGSGQKPVTGQYCYEITAWCNALTEYYNAKNGTSLRCVYYYDPYFKTIHRGEHSVIPFNDATADGFRLPLNEEWELAARYIDGTKFYPGLFASGADAAIGKVATSDYDGDRDIQGDADVAVTGYLSDVKTKAPNKIGLFDMSGNVCEICYDPSRVRDYYRGGYWGKLEPLGTQIGYFINLNFTGFRIARNAN